MIDTHTHIYEPEFDEDRDEVLQRAHAAGLTHLFLPNINEESIPRMLTLCDCDPQHLHPLLGLHPEDVKEDFRSVLERMRQQLEVPHPYVGIGEIGLDFYWDQTFANQQEEAFVTQLHWAERYNLPVVIHCRAAHETLVRLMQPFQHLRGIFHCFAGTTEEASELLRFPHFMLGIGGVLTFKKSKLPDVLAQTVPLTRLVLETDAPYLAPTPHRGKRNEPAFLPAVAERLSEVYGVSMEKVVQQTSENALQLFTLPKEIALRKKKMP